VLSHATEKARAKGRLAKEKKKKKGERIRAKSTASAGEMKEKALVRGGDTPETTSNDSVLQLDVPGDVPRKKHVKKTGVVKRRGQNSTQAGTGTGKP